MRLRPGLADLLFPASCLICGARLQGSEVASYLCRACEPADLAGLDVDARLPFPVRALGVLDSSLQRLVHALKYGGRSGVGDCLGAAMARLIGPQPRGACLVGIPLHWRRRWRRGYDQAALLARGVARQQPQLRVVAGLRRRRYTPPQVGLSAAARRENLESAFAASARLVAGARCILVDDVVTTGATLRAAAAALQQAEAHPVLAVAAAVSSRTAAVVQTSARR